jgi:hypothetical protein
MICVRALSSEAYRQRKGRGVGLHLLWLWGFIAVLYLYSDGAAILSSLITNGNFQTRLQ